jgi:hypothetical protein
MVEAAGRIDHEHATSMPSRHRQNMPLGFFCCNIAQKYGGTALFAKFVFAFGFVY